LLLTATALLAAVVFFFGPIPAPLASLSTLSPLVLSSLLYADHTQVRT